MTDTMLGLYQKQEQVQGLSPQMQMTLELVQLPYINLVDNIRKHLDDNPFLEETGKDIQKTPTVEKNARIDDIDGYIRYSRSKPGTPAQAEYHDVPYYENIIPAKRELKTVLLEQALVQDFSDEQLQIVMAVIEHVTPNGYFYQSIENIAKLTDSSTKMVEQVLEIMQTFEPAGVCARNLKECLLIQIRESGIETPLLVNIINRHLNDIGNRNVSVIARRLKISEKEAMQAIRKLWTLEPKPGRAYSSDDHIYIKPDIYLYKDGDDYKISLKNDGLPKLRVNKLYKQTVMNEKHMPKQAKQFLNKKMQKAMWLVQGIYLRGQAIIQVMQSILKFQRDFFDHGESHIKPLTQRQVAEDIDMSESTVSRVVNHKYVHTPRGLFELKYFFNSSIGTNTGEAVGSTSVKQKIKQIIENENPQTPLSDDAIAQTLRKDGLRLSRRAVANYREKMNILSSRQRKPLK